MAGGVPPATLLRAEQSALLGAFGMLLAASDGDNGGASKAEGRQECEGGRGAILCRIGESTAQGRLVIE